MARIDLRHAVSRDDLPVRRFDESRIRDMCRTTVAGGAPTAEQVQAA